MPDLPSPTTASTPQPITPETVRKFLDNWVMNRVSEQLIGKDRPKYQELLEREMLALADELAGPCPTPIEQTLAMTAAICETELRILQAGEHSSQTRSIAQSDHAQRRLNRAHSRYLSTLKTLATVRRLALPSVQVNVAHQQQVNNGVMT